MAKYNLPTNIDSSYADDPADSSVEAHQQHHDTLHALANRTENDGTDVQTQATADARYVKVTEGPLSLARYTTVNDNSADVSADVQAWLNALGTAAGDGPRQGYVPRGLYRCDTALTLPNPTGVNNPHGRNGGIVLAGASMYGSVFKNNVADYLFKGGAEALHVENLGIKTTVGGGFQLTEGGNVTFDRFHMDGCGTGFWGLHLTYPYPIIIDGCRFNNLNLDYKGGAIYINTAHTVNIRGCFISNVVKENGAAVEIRNASTVTIQSCALESRNGNKAYTGQTMLKLGGTISSGYIDGLYGEGQYNTFIELEGNAPIGVRLGSIFAWQRADGGFGDPNWRAIKAGANPITVDVDNLIVKSEVAGAPTHDGYMCDDPSRILNIRRFRNQNSSANQAGRAATEVRTTDLTGARTASQFGTTPTFSFQLPANFPGTYLVDLHVTKNDYAHGRAGTYLVRWHDDSFDFTNMQLIGSQVTRGSEAPTFTPTVDNTGLVTVPISGLSATWYLEYGYRRLNYIVGG